MNYWRPILLLAAVVGHIGSLVAQTTERVNPCDVLECENAGDCTISKVADGGVRAKCRCLRGYTGETCAEDIDECARGACLNGGTCINNPGGYTCTCPQITSGRVCEIRYFNGSSLRTTACDNRPCGNNAQCVLASSVDLYVCRCNPGWSGSNCQTASCSREDSYDDDNNSPFAQNNQILAPTDLYNLDYNTSLQNSDNYCLFGGDCLIPDERQLPNCICKAGFHGLRCGHRRTILENVEPIFGPQAGGTLVTISGANLNYTRNILITIGSKPCELEQGNFTVIVCRTMNDTGVNKISIYWPDTKTRINYTDPFYYRPNPIIEKIHPLESIISGGVLLTVSGQNMDSVAKPVLVITMVVNGTKLDTFTSVCIEVHPHRAICPTPNITILRGEDGNFSQQVNPTPQQSRRRRRELYTGEASLGGEGYEIGGGEDSRVQQRWRRQTDGRNKAYLVNNNEVIFYIGLELDGYKEYTNVSRKLEEYGQLDMYIDPKMKRWEERVKSIGSMEERRLEMTGERLDVGLKLSQYRVLIGAGECSDLQLFSNRLVCMAPDSPPEQHPDDEGPRYRVYVQIGLWKKFDIGQLEYEDDGINDTVWGIIGAAIVLAVIALVIGVVCVVKKKGWYLSVDSDSDIMLKTGR